MPARVRDRESTPEDRRDKTSLVVLPCRWPARWSPRWRTCRRWSRSARAFSDAGPSSYADRASTCLGLSGWSGAYSGHVSPRPRPALPTRVHFRFQGHSRFTESRDSASGSASDGPLEDSRIEDLPADPSHRSNLPICELCRGTHRGIARGSVAISREMFT